MSFEDPPARRPQPTLGENLDLFSVAELEQRIQDLESEIERVKAALVSKRASRGAADAFFRS